MPNRVIRSEILTSDSLSKVSIEAELLFWKLLIAADDYGRLDGRPAVLKSCTFPLRDELTPEKIVSLIQELAALPDSPLALYQVESRPYVQLVNWERHRGNSKRADHSKFPPPPVHSRKSPGDPGAPRGSGDPPEIRPGGVGRVTSDVNPPSADLGLFGSEGEESAPEGGSRPGRLRQHNTVSPRADGVAILEAMAVEADNVAELLGLPPLDCRWTKGRQKLITAANRDWPGHGNELGLRILAGFYKRARTWKSTEIRLSSWSIEALFSENGAAKNLQATQERRRLAVVEPTERAAVALPGIGKIGGAS